MHKPSQQRPDKVARTYRSELRAKAAAHTRDTILTTAMRLFLDSGYAKVTVNDIAREAHLAVPTVYASAGGKAAILATLIGERQNQNPVVEQTLATVRQSRSAREIIEVTARGTRINNERYHDILQVMVAAATVDDAAAELMTRSDDGYRAALSTTARRLKTLELLKAGLSQRMATDILWFCFGREPWHLFVHDRRWSWDDTESFLVAQANSALLDPR